MKRQATDWKKIFANQLSDIGFIFRIYEELSKLNTVKNKTKQKPIQSENEKI